MTSVLLFLRHVSAIDATEFTVSHFPFFIGMFFTGLQSFCSIQPSTQRGGNSVPDHTPIKKDDVVIWTVHDVAEYLRMSEAKVYRLVKERRIPVIRIGKTWRFRKDLLDHWLSECAELSMKSDGK